MFDEKQISQYRSLLHVNILTSLLTLNKNKKRIVIVFVPAALVAVAAVTAVAAVAAAVAAVSLCFEDVEAKKFFITEFPNRHFHVILIIANL